MYETEQIWEPRVSGFTVAHNAAMAISFGDLRQRAMFFNRAVALFSHEIPYAKGKDQKICISNAHSAPGLADTAFPV